MANTLGVGAAGVGVSVVVLVVHFGQIPSGAIMSAIALTLVAGAAGGATGYTYAQGQNDRSKEILTTLAQVRENQERVKQAANRLNERTEQKEEPR